MTPSVPKKCQSGVWRCFLHSAVHHLKKPHKALRWGGGAASELNGKLNSHLDPGTETHSTHLQSTRGGGQAQLHRHETALTFKAASPHFSIAARPWLWMCVSRSFFSSPRPSWIRDTRLYMRPKSERKRHQLYALSSTLQTYHTKYVFTLRGTTIPWNKTAMSFRPNHSLLYLAGSNDKAMHLLTFYFPSYSMRTH